jgi:hypothetical protein
MEGRFDLFDESPLAGTPFAALLKAGLAALKDSVAPDLLSEDEEDRFVKRVRLDERRVYFHESAGRDVPYHQHLIWEYREAFWLTREVSCKSMGERSLMALNAVSNCRSSPGRIR